MTGLVGEWVGMGWGSEDWLGRAFLCDSQPQPTSACHCQAAQNLNQASSEQVEGHLVGVGVMPLLAPTWSYQTFYSGLVILTPSSPARPGPRSPSWTPFKDLTKTSGALH